MTGLPTAEVLGICLEPQDAISSQQLLLPQPALGLLLLLGFAVHGTEVVLHLPLHEGSALRDVCSTEFRFVLIDE